MKRLAVLGLVLVMACPAVAQTDTSKVLADIWAKAAGALAVIKYTVKMETGDRTVLGQGICISPDGVFMTTALDPRLNADDLKDFELIAPGVTGKTIKAKLLSVDAWTGLGFVRAAEAGQKWQVVQFSPSSKVAPGQQVSSIGLLMTDPSHQVYLGTGYVSTTLRVPGDLAYVTGGWLTGACSPVFTNDGRAVGITGRQLFLGYQTPTQKGLVPLQLRSQQESSFFTPVEEFVNVLENIPADGQVSRLPWIGVNKFEAVPEDLREILKLDQPAVKLDEVIPGQPGEKAGLANRDIIVEANGQPLEKLATPDMTVQNFVRQLMRMKAGSKLTLKVLRGRETKAIEVVMGPMPTRPSEAKRYFNKALGMLVREKVMLDEYLDRSETAGVPGLVVLGLVQNGPSAQAGMRPGDVITNVNNQPVKTVDTIRQIVEQSLTVGATTAINFLVRREDQAQVITVKPQP